MGDALQSITSFVENVLLWTSIAFFSVVASIGVVYGGLRLALWLSR